MRWFRKQPTIARAMVGFVMIATVLCLLFGPIGMLYALGFEVLYLVTIGFAALLDPDRTAIGFKVGRRFQLGQRYARIVPTGDIKRFDSAKRPLSTKPSLDRPRPREARADATARPVPCAILSTYLISPCINPLPSSDRTEDNHRARL